MDPYYQAYLQGVAAAGGMGQAAGPERQAQHSPQVLPGGPRDRRQGGGILYVEGGRAQVTQWDFDDYTQVPATYRVEVTLPNEAGQRRADAVTLRPELFLLKRITWATVDGDPLAAGRTITVLWSDEFTSFLGRDPILMPALFGDSQGFLDLTREVLFAGKQTLSATLTRVVNFNGGEGDAIAQIVFHGVGLLPPGMHESGSL